MAGDHFSSAAGDDQAWLRTLVECMPQMIWCAAATGSWTWSSPQWRHYTGQSLADSRGGGWLDMVHPDDHDTARAAWQQAPLLGEFHADLRMRGVDGEYRWFQTRGRPVHGELAGWIGTSTDVDDLRQLQSAQKVLVAELQHRTRNLIAVVHSICMQTMRGASSLEEFGDRFEDRLSALSRVQGLLSSSEQDPITIRGLIELELHALAASRMDRQVRIEGPDTIVRSSTAQTLALAVHELSTNALKYGALSHGDGRLDVQWCDYVRDDHPWMHLEWREVSGVRPQAPPATRHGYGRILIEQALPQQLGAHTELLFTDDGMRCSIELPLSAVRRDEPHG